MSKKEGEIDKERDINKPRKKRKTVIFVDIIIMVFILLFVVFLLQPEPAKPKTPAFIELLNFSDLYDNQTMNVEIWLKNTGETDAMQLTVFARCRNQNGSILYEDKPTMTTPFLRDGESCSGTYSFLLNNSTKVFHTIEIQWVDGRHSYFETTTIK